MITCWSTRGGRNEDKFHFLANDDNNCFFTAHSMKSAFVSEKDGENNVLDSLTQLLSRKLMLFIKKSSYKELLRQQIFISCFLQTNFENIAFWFWAKFQRFKLEVS